MLSLKPYMEISRCDLADDVNKFVLKCVPHVQHDCFSSFNQSHRCFLALPLPTSLLKLPNTRHSMELNVCGEDRWEAFTLDVLCPNYI